MLQERSQSVFSPAERATLVAIATAAMPPGKVIPGADERCVRGLEGYLGQIGGSAVGAMRAIARALDAAAYARYLRPFTRLSSDRQVSVLEGWRTGGYFRRSALRALLTPLKMAHFDDAEIFKKLGCVYRYETPQTIDRPRYMTERVTRAQDLAADEEIECDVVVVGTGAGGAVIGRELAEQGLTVVFIEEGEYHDRRSFTGRTAEMHAKLYRNLVSTTTVGNTSIYVPTGRSVGGSTTINSGTCYRVPDRVARKWRDEMGLTDFTPDHLAPYYERVEEVLGVAPAAKAYLGGSADVVARGCEALGYKHMPLRRNAPECDGKGVCCFGCPTDAKRSTNVSYMPLALRAGAHVYTGARVLEVTAENGRATGVVAQARGGGKKLTVRARATVVACGTFQTPVLLEKSGLAGASGQLGRNLSLHPATALLGMFDRPTQGFAGIPQGYAIEEFHDEGLLFEGSSTPLDMTASALPLIGKGFMDVCENLDKGATFGFMIEDSSRGRVYARNGRSLITYVMNDNDVALLKRGVEILARVFFAAGAKKVFAAVHGFDELRDETDLARFRRAKLAARDFWTSAYHPLGTARMGVDAASSFIGPDHQAHHVRDLYVVDGSAVPSSLAVNPQLTIMALATRAAEKVGARLH
jgi:choline dehydrogenase-like flavoprotein